MHYSLTNRLETRFDKWLLYQKNLERDKNPSCVECVGHHALPRLGHTGMAGASLVASVVDSAFGFVAAAAYIVSFGMYSKTVNFALNRLWSTNNIIANPYKHVLNILNPDAPFTSNFTYGLLSYEVRKRLGSLAMDCYGSTNCLKKHVASRLTFLLYGIASVVARIIDGIIGAIAAFFSLATFGRIEILNTTAYRGLQAPGVVRDVFFAVINCIGPGAS